MVTRETAHEGGLETQAGGSERGQDEECAESHPRGQGQFQEPRGRGKGVGERLWADARTHRCAHTHRRAAGKAGKRRRRILNKAAGKRVQEGQKDRPAGTGTQPQTHRQVGTHTPSPGDGQSKKDGTFNETTAKGEQ